MNPHRPQARLVNWEQKAGTESYLILTAYRKSEKPVRNERLKSATGARPQVTVENENILGWGAYAPSERSAGGGATPANVPRVAPWAHPQAVPVLRPLRGQDLLAEN